MNVPMPSVRDIQKARKVFEEHEPRNLFYRAATELVHLAFKKKTTLSLSEALAVLLQTWNQAHYCFHAFNRKHFSQIESLLFNRHNDARKVQTASRTG